jgi:hypothetical protein
LILLHVVYNEVGVILLQVFHVLIHLLLQLIHILPDISILIFLPIVLVLMLASGKVLAASMYGEGVFILSVAAEVKLFCGTISFSQQILNRLLLSLIIIQLIVILHIVKDGVQINNGFRGRASRHGPIIASSFHMLHA